MPGSKKRSTVVPQLELKKNAPAADGAGGAQVGDGNKTQRHTIKVAVRVRPESSREKGSKKLVSILDNSVIVFDPADDDRAATARMGISTVKAMRLNSRTAKDEFFQFDNVFGPQSTQSDVYDHAVKPLVGASLSGFNSTIFAYGATGAGKTHTMIGNEGCEGIIPRAVHDLFATISQHSDKTDYNVTMSYLEVYNENIRDLLVHDIDMPVSLDLREEAVVGIVVAGLSQPKVTRPEQLLALIERGNASRTMAATDANETSSRSHAVLQIIVQHKDKGAQGTSANWNVGKLTLVDLAGSERSASVSRNNKSTMKEGCNINRSLLALGNCINSLSSGGAHVPYRDSKLTRLLKDSLGGNCRTVMVACVSPSGHHYEDTHNTLKYAQRTKSIKTSYKRNVLSVNFHASKYASIIDKLKDEVAEWKMKYEALEKRLTTMSTAGSSFAAVAAPAIPVPTPAPAPMLDISAAPSSAVPAGALTAFASIKAEICGAYDMKKGLLVTGGVPSEAKHAEVVRRCIVISKRLKDEAEALGPVCTESLQNLRAARVAEIENLMLRKQIEGGMHSSSSSIPAASSATNDTFSSAKNTSTPAAPAATKFEPNPTPPSVRFAEPPPSALRPTRRLTRGSLAAARANVAVEETTKSTASSSTTTTATSTAAKTSAPNRPLAALVESTAAYVAEASVPSVASQVDPARPLAALVQSSNALRIAAEEATTEPAVESPMTSVTTTNVQTPESRAAAATAAMARVTVSTNKSRLPAPSPSPAPTSMSFKPASEATFAQPSPRTARRSSLRSAVKRAAPAANSGPGFVVFEEGGATGRRSTLASRTAAAGAANGESEVSPTKKRRGGLRTITEEDAKDLQQSASAGLSAMRSKRTTSNTAVAFEENAINIIGPAKDAGGGKNLQKGLSAAAPARKAMRVMNSLDGAQRMSNLAAPTSVANSTNNRRLASTTAKAPNFSTALRASRTRATVSATGGTFTSSSGTMAGIAERARESRMSRQVAAQTGNSRFMSTTPRRI